MINFTIPATGSSGHIGGGILLSIILGPYAAFIVLASVMVVQALFFADGGLLALGCNIFNLGFFPCFVAYPLFFKRITGESYSKGRLFAAAIVSAVIGLQLGALGVVLETWLSGISELPLGTFLLLMQPIHLAIGLVEGLATAAVVVFIYSMQPEIIRGDAVPGEMSSFRKTIVIMIVLAVLAGGFFSLFSSAFPDGLEWSMFRTAGVEELKKPDSPVYGITERVQGKTALMPDYNYRADNGAPSTAGGDRQDAQSVSGTSLSGIIGGAFTLLLVFLFGLILRRRKAAVNSGRDL